MFRLNPGVPAVTLGSMGVSFADANGIFSGCHPVHNTAYFKPEEALRYE
jgi:hypothetical protein